MAENNAGAGFDRWIFISATLLLIMSVILIGSSSIMESEKLYHSDFYLLIKHMISIAVACVLAFFCALIPSNVLDKPSLKLMIAITLMLILVLLIGRSINGARRWINLGVVNLQPAEFLKLCWILYLSRFVSRRVIEVRTSIFGCIKPCSLVFLIAVLLLFQPDMGSLVVIVVLSLGLLWTGGAKFVYYVFFFVAVALACAVLVLFQPYRMSRVISFMDPWADQFGSGYQLTQSLMAFGRGGLWGQGLGNSIVKLGYLPEAHNDFVTSILGEELGFAGVCVVLLLEYIIIIKAVRLGFKILRKGPVFQGFVACGIGFLFCTQTFVNIGAASGALPTKGLTLPLISFGGSSMIVFCCAVAMLLRIDFEYHHGRINFQVPEEKDAEANMHEVISR